MHADRSTPNTVIGIMKVRQKSLFFLCLLGSCVPILASLVGAPRPLKNLNDSYVQKAAQFAVSEMNKQSNSLNKMVLVKVESGTVQVVAGLKYCLKVEVGIAKSCHNDGKPATSTECPVDKNSLGEWQVTVWMKPTYPPTYELLDIKKVH